MSPMSHPSSRAIGPLVLEKNFKVFYHIWAWWPHDPDVANKLLLLLSTEAPYLVLIGPVVSEKKTSEEWTQGHLKSVDD